MTIFDEKVIRNLFPNLVVGEINLNYDDYTAEVYIEVNPTGTYSSQEIENIVKKICDIESSLKNKGFIHDITFGDLVRGSWKIVINFMSEEEIEEWENNILKLKN